MTHSMLASSVEVGLGSSGSSGGSGLGGSSFSPSAPSLPLDVPVLRLMAMYGVVTSLRNSQVRTER